MDALDRMTRSPLDLDEQLRLIALAQDGNRDAEDALIRSYCGLIRHTLQKAVRGFDRDRYEEYVQVAMIAALNAIRRFDVARGNRPSTMIVKYIRIAVLRFRISDGVVRVPESAFKKASTRPQAIKAREGLSAIDFDIPVAECVEHELPGPKELSELRKALDTLLPRSKFVICRRFIDGRTLDQVGAEIGVTRERVRQIETVALQKVRAELKRRALPSNPR